MEEWLIGIYKGLRMPLLGIALTAITLYIFWPRLRKQNEVAKYNMLDDDLDDLSEKFKKRDNFVMDNEKNSKPPKV